MEKDKEQNAVLALNDESDNEDDNDLRRQILDLREQLKIVHEERNREKERACARERELDVLSNTLRQQEHSAAAERDSVVRDYHGRINELLHGRFAPGTAFSETQSNSINSPLNVPIQGQASVLQNGPQNMGVQSGSIGNHSRQRTRDNYQVPMPRQALFDGQATWESFFQPFQALAQACQWDNNEKLFRLTSCLRGEAAEYAFGQLPPEALRDFQQLEQSLEARYKEKRSSSSYLAELENRRSQPKEKISDYVADIKRLVIKGYPTADAQTREKINVRHFLKGLTDQQTGISVGMREPATIDEACQILEMYNSLRDEVKNTRVRAVQPRKSDDQYVTEKRLREFGTEIKSTIGKKIDVLSQKFDKNNRARTPEKASGPSAQGQDGTSGGNFYQKRRQNFRCFSCNGENHFARDCPYKSEQGSTVSSSNNQEN